MTPKEFTDYLAGLDEATVRELSERAARIIASPPGTP